MIQKFNSKRSAWERAESRRMLALDTLNDALRKDRISMQIAVGVLEGSNVFSDEERVYAKEALDHLDRVEEGLLNIFGEARTNDGKATKLRLQAKTLVQEVAALRESAFWLLDGNGVLAVERVIAAQVAAYNHVRRLVRIIAAKDTASIPEDPAGLPDIGPSPYLALTHPELRLSA